MDMKSEACVEAPQLRAQIQRYWKEWLAAYVLFVVAGTVVLMFFAERIGWDRAFFIVNFLGAGLLGVVASAWYGYRKYTGPRGRRSYAIFLGTMFAGAVVGGAPEALRSDRPISDMTAHKVAMIFAVVAAIAAVLVAVIATIAYLRNQHVSQRMALLQADAERERLGRQNIQAELKLLQAQVEPHFLFNTLANVRHLMQADPPQALAMLDHLIRYLRTALPEMRGEGSTLGREAQLARAYLEIMRLRMGGMLEIAIDVPDELAAASFPPLMLITLVENAIKHGISPAARGRVAIRAREDGGTIRVTVEDDGPGLGGTLGHGVGLVNLRERLAALFGERGRLDLESHASGGTHASIELPAGEAWHGPGP